MYWTLIEDWALAQTAGGDKVHFEFIFSQKQKGVEQFLDAVVGVFQAPDVNGRYSCAAVRVACSRGNFQQSWNTILYHIYKY